MKKFKLILVAGARPNFMKIAPLMHVLQGHPTIAPILVHTGQHYDDRMSDLFFRQLDIPKPAINLEVGSGSHGVQTARIMEGFEEVCLDLKPDMVMVVGDVNSTAACTLVAAKLHIQTAHYEAGLRSRDRTMPEEINRVVTDAICDWFFTTSRDADENLAAEGKNPDAVFLVGNLMIDTLYRFLEKSKGIKVQMEAAVSGERVGFMDRFEPGRFGIMTFHRPSNVDDPDILGNLVGRLCDISREIPLIFPIHPRTLKHLQSFGLMEKIERSENLLLVKPLGYLEFISMVRQAKFVLTDSGGIQEESTVLGIPCLTVRPNTERPITILEGTNKLITIDDINEEVGRILAGKGKKGRAPEFWDGKTADRMVKILESIAGGSKGSKQ